MTKVTQSAIILILTALASLSAHTPARGAVSETG